MRWTWIFGGGGMILAAILVLRTAPLPTVRFTDGRSVRVLKVSFGTNHVFSVEPLWKKSLRRMLPQPLEQYLGPARQYKTATEYDSLAIFLDPLPNGRGSRPVHALFPDGTFSPASWNLSQQWPIIFSNYPREEKEVTVRLSDGDASAQVKVPNPRRARKKSWIPRTLPQTNSITGTEVILTNCRFVDEYVYLFLNGQSAGEEPVGWMQWQTAIFDSVGNYYSEIRHRRPRVPGAKTEREFRLEAVGLEYISAGFVSAPANGQYQLLAPKARATNWGVQFVAWFGRGTYELSKTYAVRSIKSGLSATNTLRARGSGWVVNCADPVALSISQRAVSEVRVRERIGANGGRIFPGRRGNVVRQGAMVGQLFAPRLPAGTTDLEVEVIVRWPAAEFFVEKPE